MWAAKPDRPRSKGSQPHQVNSQCSISLFLKLAYQGQWAIFYPSAEGKSYGSKMNRK
jgi:hypothetical protein